MMIDSEPKIRAINSILSKIYGDCTVKEIICDISHGAVYKYVSNKWQRLNIEGPLFVAEVIRNPNHPLTPSKVLKKFFIITLNKKGY